MDENEKKRTETRRGVIMANLERHYMQFNNRGTCIVRKKHILIHGARWIKE